MTSSSSSDSTVRLHGDELALRARLIERDQLFAPGRHEPQTNFDAIIVGARIAGATLAFQLARRGWRVALVESADLPLGDTLSLPAVHARALHRMDQLNLGPVLERVTPILRQLRTFRLPLDPRIGAISGHFPPAYGHDYSIIAIRRIFDPILFEYVLLEHEPLPHEPPITFVHAACVDVDCDPQSGAICGVVCQPAKQELRQAHTQETDEGDSRMAPATFRLHAPLVIGADGRLSRFVRFVARELKQERARLAPALATYLRKKQQKPQVKGMSVTPIDYDTRQSDSTLFYGPITGMDTEGMADVEFVPGPGDTMLLSGEAGQVRGQYQIAGAFIPVSQFEVFRRERSHAIRRLLEGSSLGPRAQHIQFAGPVMGLSPDVAHGFFRPAGGAGWALVGDAAHFKDPSSGQGFHDALFTVQSLLEGIDNVNGGAPWSAEQASAAWPQVAYTVTTTRDESLRAMYDFTYQFGKGLTAPPGYLERALLRYVAAHPAATQQFLGVLSGATSIEQFQRAAIGYLALGLLTPVPSNR